MEVHLLLHRPLPVEADKFVGEDSLLVWKEIRLVREIFLWMRDNLVDEGDNPAFVNLCNKFMP